MRTLLGFLLLLSGCASSTAATPAVADQTPNFRSYPNPDRFCADAGLGYYAIGYQQVNPWTDRLFCLNAKGIHEVTVTESSIESDVRTRHETASSGEVVWIGRSFDHGHVSLADGLIECPDKSQPLAVIPVESDESYYGAFVKSGHRLCMADGNTLVLLDGRNPAATEPMHKWERFTPIP